jgi:hypothetical protein
LEVFGFPDYIKEHLHYKKYALGAALWLSRIKKEETRNYYANYAALNGVTANQARVWCVAVNDYVDTNKTGEIRDPATIDTPQKITQTVECFGCLEPVPLPDADLVYVCKTCKHNRYIIPSDSVTPRDPSVPEN